MLHAATVAIVRLTFRLVALVLIIGGITALGALVAVWLATKKEVPALNGFLAPAVACFIGGAGLAWLAGSRLGLPDEDEATTEPGQPLRSWLLVVVLTLVAVPLWLIARLQPLGAMWGLTFRILDGVVVWTEAQRAQEFSGLVVLPVLAGLLVPWAEVATAAAFVFGSIVLLPLAAWRSSYFPRAYAQCLVLQTTTLVLTYCFIDLDIPGKFVMLLESAPNRVGPEHAAIRSWLELYEAAVVPTALALAGALGALIIWLPPMFSSERVESTFTRTTRWRSEWISPDRDAQGHRAFRWLRPMFSPKGVESILTRTSGWPSEWFSLDRDTQGRRVLRLNLGPLRVPFLSRTEVVSTEPGKTSLDPGQLSPNERAQSHAQKEAMFGQGSRDDISDLFAGLDLTAGSTTQFIFNGKVYASPDELPADARQKYEQLLHTGALVDRPGEPGSADKHVLRVVQLHTMPSQYLPSVIVLALILGAFLLAGFIVLLTVQF